MFMELKCWWNKREFDLFFSTFFCLLILQIEPVRLGARQYKCPFCNKIMKDKSDMKKHIRIHTGEKPYSCDYCPRTFASTSHCYSHIRNVHGISRYWNRTKKFDFFFSTFFVCLFCRLEQGSLGVLFAVSLWRTKGIWKDISWCILEKNPSLATIVILFVIFKVLWTDILKIVILM